MAYGNTAKEAGYVTRLIALRRLSKGQEAQCETLRREAGRCWSDLVTMHKTGREQGQWISVREMEQRSAHAILVSKHSKPYRWDGPMRYAVF